MIEQTVQVGINPVINVDRSFTLEKAEQLGFVIFRDGGPHMMRTLVAAGSLAQCLAFLQAANWPVDTVETAVK